MTRCVIRTRMNSTYVFHPLRCISDQSIYIMRLIPLYIQPERYVNDTLSSSESAKTPDPMQRDHWVFGIGRRVCPGIMVAERELFLVISRMLWAFDMREIPGEPIDLKEYGGCLGGHLSRFRFGLCRGMRVLLGCWRVILSFDIYIDWI